MPGQGEQLADKPESGKSLRAIGRELAQEIERIFAAKVHPTTLSMKASRAQGVTNVSCPKLDPAEVHAAVEAKLPRCSQP